MTKTLLRNLPLSRMELRWAALAAAGIAALSCLPYLFGWWLRPGDFMGHVYNMDDANVHLAWMRQAAEGHWLYTDRFTSEPQQPHFSHLLFFILGNIARLFGGTYQALIAVYHGARVLFGWALLVSVYVFAAYIYRDQATRRLALGIAGFSSGLGWLATALLPPGDYSRDWGSSLVMPEAITFLSLYLFPLFVASMFLIMACYLLLLRAFDTGSYRLAIGAGLAALVLGNIHSYDVLPLYAVLAVYLVCLGVARRAFPKTELKLAAIVALISLPAPVYQYLIFQASPIFQKKALTPTLSPSLPQYALTFGLVLLAACVGTACLRRQEHHRGGFLVVWALVTVAMTYAPVSFQRKMIEGAHIPMALLAAAGWTALRGRLRVSPAVWGAVFIALTIPSNACFIVETTGRLVNNNAKGIASMLSPYYLTSDERAALDWLRDNAGPSDVVLCSPHIGGYMPPYCGVTVYAGHWAETMDLPRKLGGLRRFLAAETPPTWREAFLREERIRFLYHSVYEQSFGTFDPSGATYLRPVFSRGDVTIYEALLP